AAARIVPSGADRHAGALDATKYADAMLGAVDAARRHARGVVVAVSPVETAEQSRNLASLESRLTPRLGVSSWLRFVNLGDVAELHDPASRIDGWDYSSVGI